jgi:Trypsin-co-occurring domain 2
MTQTQKANPKSQQEPTFGLDEVIGALAEDLKRAQNQAAKDGAIGIYFGGAEVELQFTVQSTSDLEGGGGFSFRVFGVGVGAGGKKAVGSSNESVHRIKLTLIPKADNEAEQQPRIEEHRPGFPDLFPDTSWRPVGVGKRRQDLPSSDG